MFRGNAVRRASIFLVEKKKEKQGEMTMRQSNRHLFISHAIRDTHKKKQNI